MTRDLPAPEDRNDDPRAKALLVDLVGHFLRERKSAWWEMFSLRELPPEEHLDERAILAGLVHVRTQKRQGRQQHDRYVFRSPTQETGISDGDTPPTTCSSSPPTTCRSVRCAAPSHHSA